MDAEKAKAGLRELAVGTLLFLPCCTVPLGLLVGLAIGIAWRVVEFAINF